MIEYLKCSEATTPKAVIELAQDLVIAGRKVRIHKASGFYKISTQKVSPRGKPQEAAEGALAICIKTGIVYLCKGDIITSSIADTVTF